MVNWLLVLLGVVAVGLGGGLRWLRRRYLVVTIRGPSMLPTYADSDRVLVRHITSGQARAGDVVVAEVANRPAPDRPRVERVVKRVAAGPGDPVPPGVDTPDDQVPVGSLVLLGDNPADSTDSRFYGYVPASHVVGVVVRRLR